MPSKAAKTPGTRRSPAKKASGGSRRRSGSRGGSSSSNITSYATALRWLYDHTDYERMRIVRYNSATFNLDRMRELLEKLGNPQDQIKCVHVAGTKGKGSTCAMLESMLRACGYTVGLYSSPHLVDLRERITVNGDLISQSEFTSTLKSVQYWVRRMQDKPSFFEIMTAVGLRYFAQKAVDVAVLETGLGGRLDATNVVTPLVCGITQISLDHTEVLGRDLAAIAKEKAGIFKKGVPAITCEQPAEAARAIKQIAEQVGAPLVFTGDDIEFSYRFEANRELGPHTRVCLTTADHQYEHLAVPLRGEHQALNCGLALALLDRLRLNGFELNEAQIVQGLANTVLPGRMETAWEEPRILLDGAHNAASMAALIKAIGAHIPYDSLVMVFGCAQDKDVMKMLSEVELGADKIIFTRARNNPRAADPQDLVKQFAEVSEKMAQTADTLEEALNLAARAVSREDLICVSGSFYLVGEAKKYLGELANKRASAAARVN